MAPAAAWTLWEWGSLLADAREAAELTTADVARMVGLGERLTASDVERCERGDGDLGMLGEITEALGLGMVPVLTTADVLTAAWHRETRDRLRTQQARARRRAIVRADDDDDDDDDLTDGG